MAAYAAAVSLKSVFWIVPKYFDFYFTPHTLKIHKVAEKELESFVNFLERLDSRSRKRMNDSLARIAEAISKYEKYLTSGEDRLDPESEDFSRGIHSFVEKLKKVQEEYYALPEDEEEAVSSSGSKSKMVGLRDQRSQLKELLVNGDANMTCFSLVGMPGIGKTALAREIFEDRDISEWFDYRAWVTIGNNEWNREEIKEVILAQLDPTYEMHSTGYSDAWLRFEASVKAGKRYLIVLDDLWDYEVCRQLERAIPYNHEYGSRILLTSSIRFENTKYGVCFFDVRLLDKDESWDLLRDKVFSGDPCPPQLEDAGKKIADKCDGLPLTLLTVANHLSKAGRTSESLWIDVAEKKRHQLFTHAYDEISKVLSPSYKELEDDLKLCLLYMGVFPQKYKISGSKLINLLIDEELVDSTNRDAWVRELFEPSADGYLPNYDIECLQELYLRSLVMVYQNSTRYFEVTSHKEGIKTCGLHSSWWQFCQREARETNFFRVVDCPEDGLEEGIERQSRLSFHNNVLFARKDVYNSIEKNCASTVQSLFCFGPYHPYQVPICFGLKLLHRLDALNVRFYDFPLEVLELVELSYLALTCNGNLPPSISELQKLQFLIVHPHLSIKSCQASSILPKEIWDMKLLKHLQVTGCDLPDLGDTSLQKILTLSDVTTDSCTVLKRVPNLLKLGIRIELTPDATEPLCHFDHISHLTELKYLKCVIVNPEYKFGVVSPVASFPCLPSYLKKLSLSGLGYLWEETKKIASLPNLQVLKLRYNAFRGPMWEVDENGFEKLCTLLIESDDLVIIKGAPGSFKNLWDLRIKHCYKLEEVTLGHLEKLRKVEIVDCNPLVEMKIKEAAMLHILSKPYELKVHYSWKA